MKLTLLIALLLPSLTSLADTQKNQMLLQFHQLGMNYCDDFIVKNTATSGKWRFFMNKHSGGIDGPTTEVSLTQISGDTKQSYKTEYSFIQTSKQCFMHKKGQITALSRCHLAVDKTVWKLQHNLKDFGYQKYVDKKGVFLYTKELKLGNQTACLLNYEFRSKGPQNRSK